MMAANEPLFSVIVPTRNRPVQLARCLHAFTELDYPHHRFEVIVVDDGSSTPLGGVVAPFRKPLALTLLRQPNAGPGIARNTGAHRARGTFLAFIDDDCMPASTWLRALEAQFAVSPHALVGGRTFNALADNPYAATSQLIVDIVYAYYNAHAARARFVASNNLAVPADGFHAVGGFNPAWSAPASEDRDFCDRWLHRGRDIILAPAVVVYHAHALTFAGFCRQHFNYGRGAFRFHQERARRRSGRFRVEAGFYRRLIRIDPASAQPGTKLPPVRQAALLAVWQIANASGFLYEAASGTAHRMFMRTGSAARYPLETGDSP